MNRILLSLVVLCGGAAFAVVDSPDSAGMEVAEKVRILLKSKDVFEGGPLAGGSAVYNSERDLAFWVQGKTVYAVNERAKQAAPDLPAAPENITYDAVYEGSSTSELFRGVRPGDMAMQGSDLKPEEVEKFEEIVRAQPRDFWARTVLLGYYQLKQYENDELRKKRQEHILWLIENAPDADVVGSSYVRLERFREKEAYERAMKLMKDHVANQPKNVRLLVNAANYFEYTDRAFATECWRKCTELEPDNRVWHEKLAHALQSKNMTMFGGAAVADPNAAKEALAQQEQALALATEPTERLELTMHLADSAFDAGDTEKARAYANQLLENVKSLNKFDRAIFTHTANSVLGKIALKEGDVASAKKYLMASVKFDRPPQFMPPGPQLDLANGLLDKGEKDAVTEYFEILGKKWNKKIADVWLEDVKNGRKAREDTVLTMMMQDGTLMEQMTEGPGPNDWLEPMVMLPLAPGWLQSLDILYGLPLLMLVGVVLLVRLFSSRQNLWILAPLLFIYLVPLALFMSWPDLTDQLFGLHWTAMQHLLSTYFGSLAVLWLLSDVLARMKWWGKLPVSLVIMGVAASLGTINYPARYHIVSEISAFVIVVVASFAVAGLCCSKRYAGWKFLTLLFVFNVVFMMITWPLIFMCRKSTTFGETMPMIMEWLPMHLVIAFIDGVGLFVLLIPFFIVARFVPLYRQQFSRVLNLPIT